MSTTLNFSISGKRGTEAKKVEGKKWREKDVVIEKTIYVVMKKTSLEEKTSLSTQVGSPGPVTWTSPRPTDADNFNGPSTAWTSRSPRSPVS